MKTEKITLKDVKKETEFAFDIGGKKYYCFKSDSAMKYGRYIILQAFLQEYHLRVDLPTLKANLSKIEGWLNPTITKDGGTLQLGKALELLDIMQQRANLAFEPDTVFRLASCLYFDGTEVLSEYDKKHNEAKIAKWKELGAVDFFFHKLFQDVTLLTITSKTDLENYLRLVPELQKGWRSMEGIL